MYLLLFQLLRYIFSHDLNLLQHRSMELACAAIKPWGVAPDPTLAAVGSGDWRKTANPRPRAYFHLVCQGSAALSVLTRSVLALRAALRVRLPASPLTLHGRATTRPYLGMRRTARPGATDRLAAAGG